MNEMQWTQVIFAGRDLRRRKLKTILLLLQLSLTLLIFAVLLGKISQLYQITTAVNRVCTNKPVYFLKDFSDAQTYAKMTSESGIEGRLSQVYQGIYNNEQIEAFPMSESGFTIPDHRLVESGFFQKSIRPGSVDVEIIRTNNIFFTFFNLSSDHCHFFNDNSKSSDLPEIILGAEFARYYKPGDTIVTGNNERYIVSDILKHGMSYFKIGARKEMTNLDKMMIVQLSAATIHDSADYDAAICSAYMISDSPAAIQKVADLAAQLETYTFLPYDLSSQLIHVVRDYQHLIQINTFLDLLLIFFLILNFLIAMRQYIRQNIYEFAIHLLSGAVHIDLMSRLALQLLPILLLAYAIVIAVLGWDLFTGIAGVFGLILMGIFFTAPIRSIRKIQINSLLRSFRHE